MSCVDCESSISPKKLLACCVCKSERHYSCAGFDKVNFGKLGRKKAAWICKPCKGARKPRSSKTAKSPIQTESDDSDVEVPTGKKRKSAKTLSTPIPSEPGSSDSEEEEESDAENHPSGNLGVILTKMKGIEKSIKFNSGKLDEVLESNKSLRKIVEKLGKANAALALENNQLKGKVEDLSARINILEQRSFEADAELVNFPETKNENLKEIIVQVATYVGYEIEQKDVLRAYRYRPLSDKNNSPGVITAKFASADVKREIMMKFREKQVVTSGNILQSAAGGSAGAQLYLNDRLTPQNRKLLWQAKQIGKEYNYRFVWTRDGKIFMKKEEGARAMTITHSSQLDKLDTAKKLSTIFSASADGGYFWHMSDFHWDPNYNEKDGVCRRSVPGAFRSPGPLGEHSCDSPWALIESAVQTMKAIQGDDLEFILWTGDAVSEYLGPEEKMEALKNITDLLSRTFSSQFVFPVLGHTDPREPEKLGQLWRQWLPPDAIQSFNSGGYYMIELKSRRLKVIALNTNLWMETFEDEIDPGGQWNWLDKHLDTAKQKAEIVYLVGHVAPGFDERQGVPPRVTLATRHNTRYHNMIRKYKAVVAGQFFGHLHSDSFRIIYDQQGSPVSTIFLTPAITPKRTSSGTNNPALRLYTFDTDKGQVLNYMQYFMNLTSSNLQGEAVWEEEYNFTRYYGIDEMSPYEMNELAQSFVTQEGIKLFGRYWMANSVHSNVIPTSTRTAWTNSHFCAITQLDSADYQDCLVTRASALAAANSQPTEPSSAAGPVLQINRGFLFIAGLFIFR